MSSESSVPNAELSRRTPGNFFPEKIRREKSSKFGRVVIELADDIKPGQWLSDRIRELGGKCTERQANFIIAGRCKPNARAVLAVNAAMLD